MANKIPLIGLFVSKNFNPPEDRKKELDGLLAKFKEIEAKEKRIRELEMQFGSVGREQIEEKLSKKFGSYRNDDTIENWFKKRRERKLLPNDKRIRY